MSKLTLEQQMAQTAAETVDPTTLGKEYRNACESLPALLLQSGLLPTLTHLQASGGTLETLGKHLKLHLHRLGLGKDSEAVLHTLHTAPSAEYQTYFELALKAAVWQKRIAKARISKDEQAKEAHRNGQ